MNSLIDDLILYIGRYLCLKDKISLMNVDKSFLVLVKNDILKNTRKTCFKTINKIFKS